ncbi:uncharacterized protein [Antedon mediterranea]|uniref:uncharacterized protein n=1 Tax=Antedon mediterranea TaxID=105859 RepID=UPI003AF4F20D
MKTATILVIIFTMTTVILANSTRQVNDYVISYQPPNNSDTQLTINTTAKYKKCSNVAILNQTREGFEQEKWNCKSTIVTLKNEQRIPMLVDNVVCQCDQCVIHGCPGRCQEIYYEVPMLFYADRIDESLSWFEMRKENVSVGCQCVANSGKTWKRCRNSHC